jgi:N-acetylglucosamine-6-phosphate deacetylase
MADGTRRLCAARALTPAGWVDDALISFEGGRLTSIEPRPGHPHDVEVLLPGFIDLQVNGVDDIDVASADGDDWDRLDHLLLAQGVTSWCPTLVTSRLEAYAAPLSRIACAMQHPTRRTRIVGAHLEGPFLGSAHGAHRPELVIDIDLGWLETLPAHVALVTLGAEQAAAAAATRLLTARGVAVSIGHTRADEGQLDAVVDAGARLVTHLFNGMTGLHHREPGVAAWALTHPSIAASLIADGVHVHPRMLRLAATALGPGRTVLVTDAVAWRATRVGPLGGIDMRDGAPRLADGTLAGSALTMDAALRQMVAAGVPLEQAAQAASTTPAQILGLADRGALEPGRLADLVALDDDLQVVGTWVDGVGQ